MQKPLQISEGGSPKGTSTSQSRGDQLCKFIGTKESFKWKKCSSPTGMVWHAKIAIVLLFWDTKGAFDWEIWIYILKSGFRICNQTRNPKTNLNAEIPVLPFDWEMKSCPWEQRSLARARSKKKTAVHENSFANPFSDFPNRTVKRKSMKSTQRTDFSEMRSIFGFCVRFRISKSKSGFPNRTQPYIGGLSHVKSYENVLLAGRDLLWA